MSLELSCEDIELALLAGQADLSGFHRTNFDTDSLKNKNRVIVKAQPRRAGDGLMAANGTAAVAWVIPVEVTVHYGGTRDAAGMDAKIAAVEAANGPSGSTAGAVTLAQAAFPRGLRIEETDDSERDHSTDVRIRRRTFNFLGLA